MGYRVVRYGGADRYATAVAVAAAFESIAAESITEGESAVRVPAIRR